jgi:hypothetical protein
MIVDAFSGWQRHPVSENQFKIVSRTIVVIAMSKVRGRGGEQDHGLREGGISLIVRCQPH